MSQVQKIEVRAMTARGKVLCTMLVGRNAAVSINGDLSAAQDALERLAQVSLSSGSQPSRHASVEVHTEGSESTEEKP